MQSFIYSTQTKFITFVFTLKNSKSVGDILVGLRWKKDEETLEVTVQEASSLRIMDQDKCTSSKNEVL